MNKLEIFDTEGEKLNFNPDDYDIEKIFTKSIYDQLVYNHKESGLSILIVPYAKICGMPILKNIGIVNTDKFGDYTYIIDEIQFDQYFIGWLVPKKTITREEIKDKMRERFLAGGEAYEYLNYEGK